MNKYQEAYDYIFEKHNDSFLDRHYLDVMYELVEKATPKKLADIDTYIDFEKGYTGYSGICPVCREWCYDYHDSYYCGSCGQALDWGEEDV